MPTSEPEKTLEQINEEILRANNFIDFLNSSPEPFHVVQTVASQLDSAGFVKLNERDLWSREGKIRPNGKYYYIRNRSSIVAFAVGGGVVPGKHAFKIIGAHTDSPALKIKPRSKRSPGSGIIQVRRWSERAAKKIVSHIVFPERVGQRGDLRRWPLAHLV
jgi:aspartyl aminopeptidase